MGLFEEAKARLERLENIREIEPALRRIYTEGKKDHLLPGRDVDGVPFAKLKPSTLEKRRGPGPPLNPVYSASRFVAKYRLVFEYAASKISITADWPMPWWRYHQTGTKNRDGSVRMAKRDPGGFRPYDRQKAMQAISDWVWRGVKR